MYNWLIDATERNLYLFRSHTVIFIPTAGQISTFGLACAGRTDTKQTSCTSIPQKLAMPFLPYKTMKQVII